jgi:hypothetical protein
MRMIEVRIEQSQRIFEAWYAKEPSKSQAPLSTRASILRPVLALVVA